ncbi:unnamed protein product [marine sediment metagenome]|uniref:Uncharacterized protein n=1 Tax=marine sediment metagenome TaxID=412755 RepID=X1PN73_9ZZZZ
MKFETHRATVAIDTASPRFLVGKTSDMNIQGIGPTLIAKKEIYVIIEMNINLVLTVSD